MTKLLGNPNEPRRLSLDEALQQLMALQQRTFSLFAERRSERAPGEPTRTQSFVLRTVSERKHVTVSDLAEMLTVSPPTASQLVNTLVEKGWVTTAIMPEDRRRHAIRITDDGKHALQQRQVRRLHRIQQILSQLSDVERGQLVALGYHIVDLWESTEGSQSDGN